MHKHPVELGGWRTPASLAPAALARSTARPCVNGAAFVASGLALLLCACTKVNVTPLGATHDGRRQYEITCNRRATDDGSCHARAIALCDGSYETQNIGSTLPTVAANNGQIYSAPPQRVLLIACNAGRLRP
jgi:hypothetical protein